MMPLSEAQLEAYHRNGFLVIDNFFSAAEIDEFSEALRLVIRAHIEQAVRMVKTDDLLPPPPPGKEFDEGIVYLELIDHELVARVYDTITFVPEFLRIVAKKETQAVINQLMGRDVSAPLYGYTNRCRIDPPADERRTYGWHQEVFYTIPEGEFIQTWAPLVRDATEENGTIQVCVGSHESGVPRQSWVEESGRATQITVEDRIVQRYEMQTMDMTLGQLLFFTGRTFHRSGNNTSDKVRYSLVGMYHTVDTPGFIAPKPFFEYRGQDPKEYYDKVASNWPSD